MGRHIRFRVFILTISFLPLVKEMTRITNPLLADTDRGLKKARGILAKLFREALLFSNINSFRWDKKIDRFFSKPHNRNSPPDKGNLNKALFADEFTWGNFVKSIDFLDPVRATLVIELTWEDKTETFSLIIDPAAVDGIMTIEESIEMESDVFKDSKEPVDTLALFYRKILAKLEITQDKWQTLLETHVTNPMAGIDRTKREISSEIGTYQRDLLAPKMSWLVLRRGILVLAPDVEKYTLEIVWNKNVCGNNTTQHSCTINWKKLRDEDLSNDK